MKLARPGNLKKAKSVDKPATARDGSKKARILELLKGPDGATLAELMAATEWQAHSVRGFLSGILSNKMGLRVESTERDKDRVYCITKKDALKVPVPALVPATAGVLAAPLSAI